MSAAVARTIYSADEYLALEREAEFRHELVRGEIYAMAGDSPTHCLITANLIAELARALWSSPCATYSSDQRVSTPGGTLYTYPDATVVCADAEFAPDDAQTLTNPTLIVEVLSPSTEAWDRGGKFAHYRKIQSLREYVLVAQHCALVERYLRQGEEWVLTEFSALEATVALASVPAQVVLARIYHRVLFEQRSGR